MDLDGLLFQAVSLGASDVHLKLGRPPMIRRDGVVAPLPQYGELHEEDLEHAVGRITEALPAKRNYFYETGDLDIAYTAADLPRFRVSIYRQRGAISLSLRVIPKKVPNFEDLGLPPAIRGLADERRGLVLVTGATGSGKSTTLAAIVDHVNRTRAEHIITIEDPIEVLHADIGCIVNQREVGLDTNSFGDALRHALRQDPDTILIGELRDAETALTALQAAESGHLVFSTLHTVDAAETVTRMIEFFPEAKQQQVRTVMSGVLRGIVSQRLLPRLGGGRIAAVEVMVVNARIADLIRENRPEAITEAIASGDFFEMQTFERALIELVARGEIEREVAAGAANNRHDFLIALDRELRTRAGAAAPKPAVPVMRTVAPEDLDGLRIVRPAG